MSIFNVTLTPADLPQPPGLSPTTNPTGGGSIYENYKSQGAGSLVPVNGTADYHSPVLGGDGGA